tara:strand:- start:7807 stop:9444 length:1638 start_codon:yes stop_codon:yes gene_type:complete
MSIIVNLSDSWKCMAEDKAVQLLGYIHDIEEQQRALVSVENIDAWIATLKNLIGFFALVKKGKNTVFAAVDHIRSRPLFYAVNEQTFYLSDSAEWVRQQMNETVMDEYAKAEFQLTGYVTGKNTLYKSVKQLQAGECLVYTENKLVVKRYYSFEHREPEQYKESALLDELDIVAKASIQRMISYANGRQIVIPLSGGYDSRLIATLLKEANYDNIITFTYGIKGNKEAAYSKIVADNLGLKWYFIEYTEDLWKTAWQTEERKRYQRESSNWCSLAHMQDWLAVKIMKEQSIIENNAIFVPGHSGDMVAGSHIPNFIQTNLTVRYKKDILVEHLLHKHYCLARLSEFKILVSVFKEEIESSLALQATYSAQEFANECERYNWQNRQAKYIVNSVNVYGFFDYDWWIPLWDRNFIEFFENLPLVLRNHSWYTSYVKLKFNDNVKSPEYIELGSAGVSKVSGVITSMASSVLLEKIKLKYLLRFIYRLVIKPLINKKDGLLINSAHDCKERQQLERQDYLMNGVTAYFFLKEFDFTSQHDRSAVAKNG